MKIRIVAAIEILEARIAPAAVFVSPTTATYDDADGDHVTVKFTKPILTPGVGGNVNSVLTENGAGLFVLNLTGLAATGTGISVTAQLAGNGDGFANVGYVNSGGLALGGSVLGGSGANGAQIFSQTGIASVTIGGDLRGGTAANAGSVFSHGPIGAVSVGGSLVGGTGPDSGETSAIGATLGGSDHFGFVSHEIGAFKLGGTTISTVGMVNHPIGITGDVNLHEI